LPPKEKPFMRLKKKREFVTKYSFSRKLCPGLVIFHQKERMENFKETKGLKGRW
jgi:hypothetical protein